MKKSLAIMLALIMALALVPTVAFAENEGAEGAASGAEPAANTVKKVGNLKDLQDALNDAAKAGSGIDTTISLTANITVTANDTWTPVCVSANAGVVTLNGNGNTITGLNAPLFGSSGTGTSGIVINNLTLKDVKINTKPDYHPGVGAFISAFDAITKVELTDCHVDGGSISGTDTTGVGGLIGWTSGWSDTQVKLTNCSVKNCEIKGDNSVGGLIGHAGANKDTYHTITNCAVMGCTLTSSKKGDWRVGDLIGTANVGRVTVDQDTADNTKGNTRTQSGGIGSAIFHGRVGRSVLGTTGKLTVPDTHIYDGWSKDGTNHWHECTDANCTDKVGSIKDTAAHSFKWVIDKAATATEKGLKHEECTVCGYKGTAVEIPATGTSGGTSGGHYHPNPTPVPPIIVNPPKTGDMTIWQSILHFLGII